MRINLRQCVWVLALAVGTSFGGVTVQAVAAPFQEHEQDYSKNKTYKQGMREGQSDHARNKDHSRKREFKKEDDKRAYEAGYQKGHGDQR